jgi:hypothetical protein
MRHPLPFAALIVSVVSATAVPAMAQIDLAALDALGSEASDVVALDLNPATMSLAASLLAENGIDSPEALRIVEGLEQVQLRVFEFDGPNQYSPDVVDAVRRQFQTASWYRLVEVRDGDENVSVWMSMGSGEDFRVRSEVFDERFSNEFGGFRGLAALVAEPNEVVFVNVTGNIRPSDLAAVAMEFGVPLLGGAGGGDGTVDRDDADAESDDEDQ